MKIMPLILITVILFGISIFFRKLAVDRIHPYQIQVISGLVYLLLIPFWFIVCNKEKLTHYDFNGVVLSIIVALMSVAAAISYGFALKYTDSPGVTSALVSLSPIITMTLSILFLSEKLSFFKIIAFFLALLSAVLVNL